MPSSVRPIRLSKGAPLSALATSRRHCSLSVRGNGLTKLLMPPSWRRSPSNELRQAWNGAGDLADHVVAGDFARIGEDFPADRLDLAHVKPELHELTAERHQAAPAHRPGADAH